MGELNKMDRAILNIIQDHGRLSNVDIANRVGLSESACSRRLKALTDSGVISHYAAHLDACAVGLSGTVFVNVSLSDQREQSLRRFEQSVQEVVEVMECYLMSGDVDYTMRVAVKDAADFERIHNILTRLPSVATVHSSFALRPILNRTRLPL